MCGFVLVCMSEPARCVHTLVPVAYTLYLLFEAVRPCKPVRGWCETTSGFKLSLMNSKMRINEVHTIVTPEKIDVSLSWPTSVATGRRSSHAKPSGFIGRAMQRAIWATHCSQVRPDATRPDFGEQLVIAADSCVHNRPASPTTQRKPREHGRAWAH